MKSLGALGRRRSERLSLALAAIVTFVVAVVIARAIDATLLREALGTATSSPAAVAVALVAFGAAFALRAIAWRTVVPGLPFGQALSAIHVALGANHVLPLRLGEPLRVVSASRRAGLSVEVATASTVTLRAADIVAVVAVGLVAAPRAFAELLGSFGWVVVGGLALAAVVGWRWLGSIAASDGARTEVVRSGSGVFALAAAAWLAESVLVWEAARWAGLELSWGQAVLVTAVAVAAQVAAIAPGGFGTYEAAAVAAYVTLGYDADAALVAAIGAHGLKTAYSLIAGAIALLVPAPGLLGRLRLDRRSVAERPDGVRSTLSGSEGAGGSVLLFMPALDEEASVAACVERVPREVLGRPVEVLVIDDGSVDATAARASDAGAEVLSLDRNRGLGAAVRIGLANGVEREACAIVFCDADGEYPPEELENLVSPILTGEADYVTGSRFLGRIDHMRPHRRLGNVVLTLALSIVARRRITDGQTGYRALSPRAAAAAEIIHDFNYAQVLTLDLLAKGFRHVEVPISYHFRTEGESFVKLGRYLRTVVPAVYRELNAG